jgi:hypothetical protein
MSSCSSTVNTNRNRIRIEHNLLEQLSNYVEKFHENATFRPAGEYRQDTIRFFFWSRANLIIESVVILPEEWHPRPRLRSISQRPVCAPCRGSRRSCVGRSHSLVPFVASPCFPRDQVAKRAVLGHGLGVNLDVYTVAALDKRQDAMEVLESALARRCSA